jgi:hypothetical protein
MMFLQRVTQLTFGHGITFVQRATQFAFGHGSFRAVVSVVVLWWISKHFYTLSRNVYLRIAAKPANCIPDVVNDVGSVALGGLNRAAMFIPQLTPWRKLVNWCLQHETKRDTRKDFNEVETPVPNPVKYSTHPLAATNRAAAKLFIRKLAKKLRVPLYDCQGSMDAGVFNYYWAKDLTKQTRYMDVANEALYSFIDVDYYMNLPSVLGSLPFNPVAIYTIIPESAADDVDDSSFCFTSSGEIRYTLTGGGSFTHQLWSYAGDNVTLFDPWTLTTSVYLVEKRHIAAHRYVVYLMPVARYERAWSLLSLWLIDHNFLERFKPIAGQFVAFRVKKTDGMYLSISRHGPTGQPRLNYLSTIPS